jgi:hypothetical protein
MKISLRKDVIPLLVLVCCLVAFFGLTYFWESNRIVIGPLLSSDDIQITNVQLFNDTALNITVQNFDSHTITVTNGSVSAVTEKGLPISGTQIALIGNCFPKAIAKNTSITLTLSTPASSTPFTYGASYSIYLQTSKNTTMQVAYTYVG